MIAIFNNPVMRKEIRTRMRGNRAMLTLTIYLILIAIVTLLIYATVLNSLGNNNFEAGQFIGKGIFLTVMTTALIQICCITPALTAGSIIGEKERQSYDIMLITTLSVWDIVLGKLITELAFTLMMIIAVLPLASLAFLFGGVTGAELIIALIGLCVTALCYATVGLFWSTVMRTTQGATTIAIGSIVLVLLFIPFLIIIIMIAQPLFYESPIVSHILLILASLHPFLALGSTEALISQGEPLFTMTFSAAGADYLFLSPWLLYTIVGLLLSWLFLTLTIRRIRAQINTL